MNILTLVMVTAGAAYGIGAIDNANKTQTIANAIRSAARDKASDGVGWFNEAQLEWKKNDAARILRQFKTAEKSKITQAFNSDDAAKTAVKNLNRINKQYDAAKKAVDNFKGNNVSVAVGSGDNAAAVSIQDDSQKVILEAKLADISAERDAAKEAVDDIRKAIADKITDERPIEHTEAIEALKKAEADYNEAVNSNRMTVEHLLNDREWRHKEFVKAYQANHSEAELIGKACIMSILPVAALVYIWKGTLEGLTILKEVV